MKSNSPRTVSSLQGSLIALHLLALLAVSARGQGILSPLGPPAPTMKTLEQIEPRIDLQNAPASAVTTTNANYHFIITQPGSYFLSANLNVTKPNGIQINAEGVTLDLRGFQIARTSGAGGNGIEIPVAGHRASILNGSLKGFSFGLEGAVARGCSFRDLAASGCNFAGIYAGFGAALESCRVHDNSGGYGIFAGEGSSLTNCVAEYNTVDEAIAVGRGCSLINCSATNNTAAYGFFVNAGSSLANCSAAFNTSSAASSAGIYANASTVTGCASSNNTSTAPPTPSTGRGFELAGQTIIHHCAALFNKGDGISVLDGAVVRDNNCAFNGNGGDGAGIHATVADNRIEGNNVTSNDRGIDVDVAGNLIVKNSASGNTNNWDVVAGNVILVINATTAAAVNGNSGGTAPGSTDPNANFTY